MPFFANPVPVKKTQPARLRISGGKSAVVERQGKDSTHQIVVRNEQGNKQDVKLTVYTVHGNDKNIHMAFCFELKKIKYIPGVDPDSKKLILNKTQSKPKIYQNFLFRWAHFNKSYGSLCSVTEPGQYLHIDEKNSQVVLSSNPDLGFKIEYLPSDSGPMSMFRAPRSDAEGHKELAMQRMAMQWRTTRGRRGVGGGVRRTSRRRKKRVL